MDTSGIFSVMERSDSGPAKYAEGQFKYLDRSARPSFARIRQLLNQWWAGVPSMARSDLVSRIRSGDDQQFIAAVFELYVHQLLRQTGHEVELHRKATNSKQPDFTATAPDGYLCVLEAVVATEISDLQRGKQKLAMQLYDTIDLLNSPDFFLSMEIEGEPSSPLPGRRWLGQSREWVKSLDYGSIDRLGRQGDFDLLPHITLEHEGFAVRFAPIAKKQQCRGTANARPIGALSTEGELVRSWESIQRVVRKKSARYGQLGLPYLIAVNGLGVNCDFEEFYYALYGPTGYWRPGQAGRYTRVSGVLGVVQLTPTTIGSAQACLFLNPHAVKPYTGPLQRLPHVYVNGSDVCQVAGASMQELLSLPDGWPGYCEDNT